MMVVIETANVSSELQTRIHSDRPLGHVSSDHPEPAVKVGLKVSV